MTSAIFELMELTKRERERERVPRNDTHSSHCQGAKSSFLHNSSRKFATRSYTRVTHLSLARFPKRRKRNIETQSPFSVIAPRMRHSEVVRSCVSTEYIYEDKRAGKPSFLRSEATGEDGVNYRASRDEHYCECGSYAIDITFQV